MQTQTQIQTKETIQMEIMKEGKIGAQHFSAEYFVGNDFIVLNREIGFFG